MYKLLNTAYLAINSTCNNRCMWCYDSANHLVNGSISKKLYEHILLLLYELNCSEIVFLGGEPTLHPDISFFINSAAGLDISSILVTNGTIITNEFFKSIKRKEYLTFNYSIQGSNAVIHDSITNNKGSFNALINNLQKSIELGIKTYSITTLNKRNQNDLKSTIELLIDKKIPGALINLASPPLNSFFDKSEFLSEMEYTEAISEVALLLSDQIKLSVGPSLPFCKWSNNFKELISKNKVRIRKGCHLLYGRAIVIDYNGNIVPCTHVPSVQLSNISLHTKDSFSKFLLDINESVRKPLRKFPLKECALCKDSDQCDGGCPLLWMN